MAGVKLPPTANCAIALPTGAITPIAASAAATAAPRPSAPTERFLPLIRNANAKRIMAAMRRRCVQLVVSLP